MRRALLWVSFVVLLAAPRVSASPVFGFVCDRNCAALPAGFAFDFFTFPLDGSLATAPLPDAFFFLREWPTSGSSGPAADQLHGWHELSGASYDPVLDRLIFYRDLPGSLFYESGSLVFGTSGTELRRWSMYLLNRPDRVSYGHLARCGDDHAGCLASPTFVPEPATLAMFALGGAGLLIHRKRRNR